MPRMKKPARANKPARAKKSDAQWWNRPPAIAAAVVSAMGIAVLIAALSASSSSAPANAPASSAAAAKADVKHATSPASDTAHATTRAPAAPGTRSAAADASDAETATGPAQPPVTITGCLARGDDAFELKDTTGENAPKSRSWKSGFLKKSAASIEVVDSANRVKLSNHVGERVSVTGTLVDRKMTVRSLQRVAPTCDGGSAKVKA